MKEKQAAKEREKKERERSGTIFHDCLFDAGMLYSSLAAVLSVSIFGKSLGKLFKELKQIPSLLQEYFYRKTS